jgi:hypothetical protein
MVGEGRALWLCSQRSKSDIQRAAHCTLVIDPYDDFISEEEG